MTGLFFTQKVTQQYVRDWIAVIFSSSYNQIALSQGHHHHLFKEKQCRELNTGGPKTLTEKFCNENTHLDSKLAYLNLHAMLQTMFPSRDNIRDSTTKDRPMTSSILGHWMCVCYNKAFQNFEKQVFT